jgi:Fibronectin type-III domain/Bacterial pre-peptidase C-terminal domain
LAFLCGAGLLNPAGGACTAFGFLAAHNLNLPSLTSEVVGSQTIRRTVTNVGTSTSTYTGAASIPGYTTTVSPASLTLAPGARGNFTVTALRTTAPIGSWVFGNLDWTNGAQTIRSPLTLKALQMSVLSAIEDTRIRANKVVTIGAGYTGMMKATTGGLMPATRTAGVVNLDGSASCTAISVPAGSNWLRVALFDSETTGQGLDDLDLEVRNAAGVVVAGSGGATSNELVNFAAPAAGNYQLCVVGFGSARAGATSSNFTLSHWLVSPSSGVANSLRVSTPATVATAGTGSVAFMWSVAAGQRHFGTVQFNDGVSTSQIGQTSVYIDGASAVLPAAVNSAKELAKANALAIR